MNHLQIQASDPSYSVWVCASAGTGKTKILTDRVLRILISGAEFKKILCLTFTNNAAAEMQERINSKLLKWSNIKDDDLTKELYEVQGRSATKDELQTAKNLYQKMIDQSETINIYTIHAFCQKILQPSPLAAGLNPNFQIIDDTKKLEIIHNIKQEFYTSHINPELITFCAANFHEMTITDIFNEIISNKEKFLSTEINYKNYLQNYYPNLEYQDEKSAHQAYLNIALETKNLLSPFIEMLDFKYHIESIEHLKKIFLTNTGEKRTRIIPAHILKIHPPLANQLIEIQDKIYNLEQNLQIIITINYSSNLLNLAHNFIKYYEKYKKQYNFIDYDDLITQTKIILLNPALKPLLLKMFDGDIQHLLIDEAQDTSPLQWKIIQSIFLPNASSIGSAQQKNTIFVVGDDKQSIFSFQGADLSSFSAMNQYLSKNFDYCEESFRNITLECSYRSSSTILDFVYQVFNHIKNNTPKLFPSVNPKVYAFRKVKYSTISLWPLVIDAKDSRELIWPLPYELTTEDKIEAENTPEKELAKQIAQFIKQQIETKIVLDATGKPATPADFMILVRKREKLTFEILNQLEKYGISTDGLDRISLKENLAVADLISIAKFVLSPFDNLNLACLLKSPVSNANEEIIQYLTINNDSTIWHKLQEIAAKDDDVKSIYLSIYQKLLHILHLYKNNEDINFFHQLIDRFGLRNSLINNNSENHDAINELLYLSYNYFQNTSPSLQHFIYWFENNNIDIKRNTLNSDKVKIMTVHASKGLQAPFVILCDTTSAPSSQSSFIWHDNKFMLASPPSINTPQFLKELKKISSSKEMQEYLRLLYVALTRAEDHLIICGYNNSSSLPENCWYDIIKQVIPTSEPIKYNNNIIESSAINQENANLNIQYTAAVNLLEKFTETKKISSEFFQYTPQENNIDYKYNIQNDNAVNLEYGYIFHKILEDSINAGCIKNALSHKLIKQLDTKLQLKIQKSLKLLLNNNEFTQLLSNEIKTEINIGAQQEYGFKSGRIDLMAISKEEITIIDYKTDTSPPTTKVLVPYSYIEQLNFYKYIIQNLYPHHKIICKILWLENSNLMMI